jgi:pimeloyl-ACP methyl ester carboxylesterase
MPNKIVKNNVYRNNLIKISNLIALFLLLVCACGAQAQDKQATEVSAAAPESKTVTVYGAKVHYLEAGAGQTETVILLHGMGGDATNWAQTIKPLAAKYRVFALDQIGFGLSEKPSLNYRIMTFVDFLNQFYKELKIEKTSLVGNSLGGWIAATFALTYPEKVERLVLVDSSGFKNLFDRMNYNVIDASSSAETRRLFSLLFYDDRKFVSDAAVERFFAKKIANGDSNTIQRLLASFARGEDMLDNRLAAVKQPTLIIWGREDELIPLEHGERLKKEIKGSQLFIIDKCGHVPQIECADVFNPALLKFLSEANTGSK